MTDMKVLRAGFRELNSPVITVDIKIKGILYNISEYVHLVHLYH